MVIASNIWCESSRDGSTKWECWYYLENIGVPIFRWIWYSAVGFCWCDFDVRVENNVSWERAETRLLGTISLQSFRLGERDVIRQCKQRCVPLPRAACIFSMGPSESSLSHPMSQIWLGFSDATMAPDKVMYVVYIDCKLGFYCWNLRSKYPKVCPSDLQCQVTKREEA